MLVVYGCISSLFWKEAAALTSWFTINIYSAAVQKSQREQLQVLSDLKAPPRTLSAFKATASH